MVFLCDLLIIKWKIVVAELLCTVVNHRFMALDELIVVVTFVGAEYICAGEGVWGRPSESHHLSPECCSTWCWQGDLRAHHHRNRWGNSQVMCQTQSGLSLLLSNHSPALLSDRSFPTRWLTTCSVSASEEPLRNSRLKSGYVSFWVSFQLQFMKDLIVNICCCCVLQLLAEHGGWRIRSQSDPESAPWVHYRERPWWQAEVSHHREDGGKELVYLGTLVHNSI